MIALDSLFYPRSIAVIGASRQPGSVGHSLLANLLMNRPLIVYERGKGCRIVDARIILSGSRR